MSFVDPFFFIFLIIAFTGFHFLNETGRKSVGISFSASGFLLILSLFFYGYFKPVYLFLLIGSSLAAWFAAGLMDGIFLKKRFLSIDGSARKWILAAAVTGLLFPLFFFKYSNFALSNLQISGIFENAKPVHFLLPLGISFFTFQNISYITDVYRKMIPAEKNPFKYGLYISFFPQLVAGPIVTARSFLPQLEIRKKFSDLDLRLAAFYLLSGYIKKTVFADRLGVFVDPVFHDPSSVGWIGTAAAVLGYSFQIYFDFSGYSDIAIGIGHLFGIKLPENFNFPYSSAGFRQFWRNWHITLSIWLRDHIYIPLGGSRQGRIRLYLSLVATMFLGGLWHGAHWNFVIWGLGHGALLVLDRFVPDRISKTIILKQLYVLFTFLAVSLLWIFFRTASEEDALDKTLSLFHSIFTLEEGAYSEKALRFVLQTSVLVLLFTFFYNKIFNFYRKLSPFLSGLIASALILLIIVYAPRSSSFIYFVF